LCQLNYAEHSEKWAVLVAAHERTWCATLFACAAQLNYHAIDAHRAPRVRLS